jgi:hypothetical protein
MDRITKGCKGIALKTFDFVEPNKLVAESTMHPLF